jgi:two-component system, OmpR family, response regulator QseB
MAGPTIDDVVTQARLARVLVVEDDPELVEMLNDVLGGAGYDVDAVRDGQAGLHHALTRDYDAMIIDRGLPAVDGLDLIRRLRRRGIATPLMMLTAYGSVPDRVAGLDAGAEDYMVKPFEIDEFLARVRALIRRHRLEGVSLSIGAGTFEPATQMATRADGSRVELSRRESALLRALASVNGRPLGREELRRVVFDSAESATIVDTYVHYLRRKLGDAVIRTVRGHGYQIGVM